VAVQIVNVYVAPLQIKLYVGYLEREVIFKILNQYIVLVVLRCIYRRFTIYYRSRDSLCLLFV
jgi:hypothetical protein